MNKSTEQTKNKNKVGRPATGRDVVISVRLPDYMIAAIDALKSQRKETRSKALRHMLEGIIPPPSD